MTKPPETPPVIQPSQIDTDDALVIVHGKDLHTYEVTKDTLQSIKRAASSGSDELAWGIGLLTFALSSIITLATTDIESIYAKIFFILVPIVGIALGSYFLKKWWPRKSEVTKIVDDILESPEKKRKIMKDII